MLLLSNDTNKICRLLLHEIEKKDVHIGQNLGQQPLLRMPITHRLLVTKLKLTEL